MKFGSAAFAIAALFVLLFSAGAFTAAVSETPVPGGGPAVFDAREFGAKADGTTDDTNALQAALEAAAKAGGGIVQLAAGRYWVNGHLEIPANCTLRGTWTAPPRSHDQGSVLLAYADKGKPDGPPFIQLHINSCVEGLAVYYPEQKGVPPIPYPWCIRGTGDDCSIVNVLLVNPYQAVDFGTTFCGRHWIDGLYAMPIYKGLLIDQCLDVGRVQNVHFWPFGNRTKELADWMLEHATAFIIGRTDWEYMVNCFALGYAVGYHFLDLGHRPGNAILLQCGSDIGPLAVKVEQVQAHSGVSFVNSQFMAAVEVGERNAGPVKFTACGFWPLSTTAWQAKLAGRGTTTFNGCHFAGWDQAKEGVACLEVVSGGVIITSCDFFEEKTQIHLAPNVESAIIAMNRFRGGEHIKNESKGSVQIGLNSYK